MIYTQIPEDVFQHLQLNAGVLVDEFTPSSGEIGNIVGATSGGVNFEATPTFEDFGADVDNCPTNTMELKKLTEWAVHMGGNFLTVTAASAKDLIAAADVDSSDTTKVTPRADLKLSDFKDIWWVGDYSDKNDGTNAGFVAIHMLNVLNTGGFKLQSTNKGKGTFAFDFTAHYSIREQTKVPFEVFVKAGA